MQFLIPFLHLFRHKNFPKLFSHAQSRAIPLGHKLLVQKCLGGWHNEYHFVPMQKVTWRGRKTCAGSVAVIPHPVLQAISVEGRGLGIIAWPKAALGALMCLRACQQQCSLRTHVGVVVHVFTHVQNSHPPTLTGPERVEMNTFLRRQKDCDLYVTFRRCTRQYLEWGYET